MNPETIPRLPVFGWQALRGGPAAMPCMLDLPRLQYTTSGRAAILLALEALGVGAGHQVLVPTYHCPTMVAPVTHLGATPVFYPIDAHGTPRLDWMHAQGMTQARALIAPHYFGLPQPMGRIKAWCTDHGLALIEDCAHALFGHAEARPVGAWGDVAIGSITKFLPVPEGGCLVLNQPLASARLQAAGAAVQAKALLDLLEVGASQRQLAGLNGLINGTLAALRGLRGQTADAPPPGTPPYATTGGQASGAELLIDAPLAHRRLSRVCASLAQRLPRERVVQRRRSNYVLLARALEGHAGLRPLLPTLPDDCAPYVFPLWVDQPDPGYAALRRLGMPVFRWDRLWPGVPHWPDDHGRHWSHHVIQLACHQDLDPAALARFVHHVLHLYAARA